MFFTNAILGIRRKGNKSTGKSPAFKDSTFIKYCQRFLLKQIELQKPQIIIVLGKYVAEFLAPLNDKLKIWNKIENYEKLDNNKEQVIKDVRFTDAVTTNLVLIVHPSYRKVNVKWRKFLNFKGEPAEIEMIRYCLNNK